MTPLRKSRPLARPGLYKNDRAAKRIKLHNSGNLPPKPVPASILSQGYVEAITDVVDGKEAIVLQVRVRHTGSGPRYLRIGPRRIRYLRADVMEWLDSARAQRHRRLRVQGGGLSMPPEIETPGAGDAGAAGSSSSGSAAVNFLHSFFGDAPWPLVAIRKTPGAIVCENLFGVASRGRSRVDREAQQRRL